MKIEQRYTDGSYLSMNPDWDRGDAAWKAELAFKLIKAYELYPQSICEVGCGSGDILRKLSELCPSVGMVGYDVSPQLQEFWRQEKIKNIEYHLADFHIKNSTYFDILLMLDVFEHVRDPFTFLEESVGHAKKFIFHIPLDLSAVAVTRAGPLLSVRRNVGHLHFYTKDLALETLKECGYHVIEWQYTGAATSKPNRAIKTRLAQIPRIAASLISKDWAVRLLGGETLIVLAEPASGTSV